jgi:hypothetical protein|tara:strand:+ start:650 stop:865 length:216 start_codon:yes stop_codon:yes gene_type:complete
MGRLLTAAAVAAVESCLRDILRCGCLATVVRAAGRKAWEHPSRASAKTRLERAIAILEEPGLAPKSLVAAA